jgi:hypothetical protein
MKIDFDTYNYIEFSISPAESIYITVCAKDGKNSGATIINSAEITQEQFIKLVQDVQSKLKLDLSRKV